MRLIFGIVFLGVFNFAASGVPYAQDQNTLPLPRDPEIAVQEEFDTARISNTPEAWRLFIARHTGHALASQAAKRLSDLEK